MSWQAMDAIDQLEADVCKPLAFRVLMKLANVAAQDGTRAWRFVPEMADELGRDERTVRRALRELEEAGLIRKGDQRAVAMWNGNRRPTVYDINMGHPRTTILPLDDDDELGGTQLSTGELGGTSGGTTGVQQRELRELLNSSTQDNQTGDVPPAPFIVGQCPVRGRIGHAFDPGSGYCTSCGTRDDA